MHSPRLWKPLSLLAFPLVGAGCLFGQDSGDGVEVPRACVRIATNGADGGPGGQVTVMSTAALTLDGGVRVDGGPPGRAGHNASGPPANDGSPGSVGRSTIEQVDTSQLDGGAIIVGSALEVAAGETMRITDLEADGTRLVRERIVVGAEARLILEGVSEVVADELVVSQTGTLIFVPAATASDDTPHAGPAVTVDARRLEVAGTIAADGGDGQDSVPGGAGGDLTVYADDVALTETGSLSARGGAGGPGRDERPCP